MIGSRFIHLIRTDSKAILFIPAKYSIVYKYHNFLTHSSADGRLRFQLFTATVNGGSLSIGVHVSFSVLVSSRYMPYTGIAGSCGSFIPSFLKESPYSSP